MQIIGFNFTKIMADSPKKVTKTNIVTNIEFKDLAKEEVNLMQNKSEAVEVSFLYSLTYENSDGKDPKEKIGEVSFEGKILLSVSDDELKNILKAWKKKELPNDFKVPLFNLILKKCTPKAVYLQDEVNLPSHIPMPRLQKQNPQ